MLAIEVSIDFQQENDCGAELKAGASCEIKVRRAKDGDGRGELKIKTAAGNAGIAIAD
jgi:hypothetical protein